MSDDTNKKSKIAEREEEILKFWKENKIFEKSLAKPASKGEFVFYDGPPFATGLPHYGHILAGTIKDVVPRYKTMQGFNVRRMWGWDCHGLPIENLIEKELNLGSKKEIEEYGIEKFNKAAKESVLRYDSEWKKFIPRVGRWVDMDHPYKTMDANYTESVWWSFKTLWDKKLVYEGYKVMPYCPHCGTTLSNFEVNQGYKDISDISIYVKFKIKAFPDAYFLAWTTTPWTLPGNVALAVGKDIEYVEAKINGEILVLAKDRLDVLKDEPYEIVATHKGSEMVGMEYEHIFSYYNNENLKNKENAFKVYVGDFVTSEDGTGIVHIAPAFGEDDMNLGKENNLPIIQHIDREAKMKSEVIDFAGLAVKPKSDDEKERVSTDIEIIKYLQNKNLYFDKKKITHSYPHCWRCDTPLINYASSSWFVKVYSLRDRMVELNATVNWNPRNIGEGRFGKWLEGARDWAISRSRFWGAPIPVWKCSDCDNVEVVESFGSLKERIKSSNKYFVMRHGEAEQNIKNIVNSDPKNIFGLTEKGKKEVAEAVKEIRDNNINLIVTSPFERCIETANIIKESLGLGDADILVDDRLWELKTGSEYEGKTWDEYLTFFKNTKERFSIAPTGGETLLDLQKRAGEFLYEMEQKYKNRNILFVTHEGTLSAMKVVADGLDLDSAIKTKEEVKAKVNYAELFDLNFTPLSHNENYELDVHRPYIDEIKWGCTCGGTFERIKEVFDTWYDSGSMPYASVHYPFENKEIFENGRSLFPADFIAEGLDQTRGWFYTLLALSVGIFDKTPYENVIVNGIVLAEDGQKMSKRLKNYPDPISVIDKYGADSLRYYLISSQVVKAEDLAFSEKSLDEVYKKVVLKLDNVLNFYSLYKEEGIVPSNKNSSNILDLWILSKLNKLGVEIEKGFESYELDKSSRPILDFVDDFSTWYIRRSRDRFKSDDVEDKNNALSTTLFVLVELAKYMAPFTPFFAEYMYQHLKSEGDDESVHLCDWPHFATSDEASRGESEIIQNMDEVRRIVSLGLEKRMSANIKVRQPLKKLKAFSLKLEGKKDYIELIKDEINVKEVEFVYRGEENKEEVELDTEITEELKKEGDVRELVRFLQDLRKKGGLEPKDEVNLYVGTSDSGKKFIEEFESEIKRPTNIKEIIFEYKEGSECVVGDLKFILLLKSLT